ncbi:serine/threonine-protein kinase [Pseudonocardia sp.]|uniref:serine/threonine-protein kinase n=1 Tax=Pseudonocardia sp. TaxID=60912 RepID=UPI003D151A78
MTTQFGRFRLERLLGRGGMGEVYEAFDTRTQRLVAVKRLRRELAVDAGFQARFRRESALAARIGAPHIVPVHDYGEIDGQLFIEMQLIRGADLGVLLRDGPLPAARAVEIVAQVAEALDAAHAEGLVHRDVKPSNVLVAGTARDHAYLVDFGIARAAQPEATALTQSGATVGTLDYMAPERFQGTGADHRADVYALACVLFEALTGHKPFPADDPLAVMYAHLHRPPPAPGAHRAGLPPALDEVVARGMAKDPAQRFPSAGALAAAAQAAVGDAAPAADASTVAGPGSADATVRLPPQADRTRVAGTGDTTGVPRGATHPHPDAAVDPLPGAAAGPRAATPARRRRLAVAGFAALAAALVAVGVAVAVPLLGTQADPAVPSAPDTPGAPADPPVLTSAGAATVGSGTVRADAFGDGDLIVAMTVDGLTLVAPATMELLGIVEVPGASDQAVVVAPDGDFVGVSTAAGAALVDTRSDARLTGAVPLGAPATGLAVHPTSKQLIVATQEGLRLVDPSTAAAGSDLLPLPGQKFGLAALPGGDRVYVADADTNEVLAVDAATAVIVATVDVTAPHALALSPDGGRLYVAGPGTVHVISTADHTVTATVLVPAATDRADIAVSPDGRHAFVVSTGAITVLDTASAAVVATVETGPGRDPADVGVTSGGLLFVGTLAGELLTYTVS